MYDEVSVSAVENEGYEFPGASHLIERDPEESGGIAVVKPRVLNTHGPQFLSLLTGEPMLTSRGVYSNF